MADFTFMITNSTGETITWVSAGHNAADGQCDAMISVASMKSGENSKSETFPGSSTGNDWWYVSFLDDNGNLWSGDVQNNYGESDGLVTITLNSGSNPPNFTVSFTGGSPVNGTYLQN